MKIYIINGHHDEDTFCDDMVSHYAKGAREGGHDVRIIHLRDLQFDPILKGGYSGDQALEPDLKSQQDNLLWCEHLVIATPVWWMGVPALLKGFFDRVLLPGFAFQFHGDPQQVKKLSGRTARVLYTQDTAQWRIFLKRRDCFWHVLKDGILGFIGFAPVKRTFFERVYNADEIQKAKWFEKISALGRKAQ